MTVRTAACLLALAPLLMAASPADRTAANRAIVTDFARRFYHDRDVQGAFDRYVAPDYIQHSPNIADGRQAAIRALTPLFASPDLTLTYAPPIVDGDRAVIEVHAGMRGGPGSAIVDIFRLAHGRIVEHWDVNQAIPAHAANPHPLF